MKLKEIQQCIRDYQEFIKTCSGDEFLEYFSQADYCDFISKSFTSFPNDNLNLFLGIKDHKLLGFLVNENVEYIDWTDQTQVFDAEFKSFSALEYQAFKEYYEKKMRPDSSCAIECGVGFNRIETWSENKFKWFSENEEKRTLVKYFEIPKEGYANGQGNTFNLGLLVDNRIDIIVGCPSGLFDTSRPVPPFDSKF